jgi:hypothetical protein
MKYYSSKTGGFYLAPNDHSVEISDQLHSELLQGNCTGRPIIPDANGFPILGELPKANPRIERDRLLLESDFRMIPDSPFDKAAWGAYRQDLRDLTKQVGYPDNVAWPEAPVK